MLGICQPGALIGISIGQQQQALAAALPCLPLPSVAAAVRVLLAAPAAAQAILEAALIAAAAAAAAAEEREKE
jgi:hypothetical protein